MTESVPTLDAPASDPAPSGRIPDEPGERRRRRAETTRAAVETLIGTGVFVVIWSFLLNAVLDMFHTGGSLPHLVGHMLRGKFPLFALNTAVVMVVLLLLLALIGRLWLTCAISLAIAIALGMVNHVKLGLRNEPLYPSDVDFLRSPGFLFTMVSPVKVVLGVAALVVLGAVVVLVGRVPTRTFRPIHRQATPRIWYSVVGARVVTVVLSVSALAYLGGFNDDGNRFRQVYEKQGDAKWAFWFQKLNYTANGFVAGTLYNLRADPMKQPGDYSRETMREVAARYQARADQLNLNRSGSLADVNVVTVLSEAFSDPTKIEGAEVTGDPIPFTRKVMAENTSGTMLAQLFGGGTANMEFEVLTGQSLAEFQPQVNTPYQQFVHDQPEYPSVVGHLKHLGHRAVAVHPYMTAMYHRSDVYQTFGIDEFIYDKTMHDPKHIDDSDFISDDSAFSEVTRQIEASSAPLFANLVTMQNHYPMSDKYEDPWPVSGVSGDLKKELAGYARGLNHSDQALERWLTALESSKEKVAVIFYGDHLPAFWGMDKKLYERNGEPAMKSTPFFIWTNFESTRLETSALTSPTHFLPLLFNQVGAPLPPYYALLDDLYRAVPAMEQGVRYDAEGNLIEDDDLDASAQQLLRDYRLVQYDLSVGERYSQETMFPQAGR